jgi:hypothetical protein
MNVAEILEALESEDLSVEDLETVAETATGLAEGSETAFAKVFDLADRVKVDGIRGVVTVVRRNLHTVTVADRDGTTTKIVPSDITEFVEEGDITNFDYYDYFGTEAVSEVEEEAA